MNVTFKRKILSCFSFYWLVFSGKIISEETVKDSNKGLQNKLFLDLGSQALFNEHNYGFEGLSNKLSFDILTRFFQNFKKNLIQIIQVLHYTFIGKISSKLTNSDLHY